MLNLDKQTFSQHTNSPKNMPRKTMEIFAKELPEILRGILLKSIILALVNHSSIGHATKLETSPIVSSNSSAHSQIKSIPSEIPPNNNGLSLSEANRLFREGRLPLNKLIAKYYIKTHSESDLPGFISIDTSAMPDDIKKILKEKDKNDNPFYASIIFYDKNGKPVYSVDRALGLKSVILVALKNTKHFSVELHKKNDC